MIRSAFRTTCAMVIVLLSLLLPLSTVVQAQSDNSIEQFRDFADSNESVYGPERGSVAHDPDAIAFERAGVSLRSFYVTVTVKAPYDDQDQLWDTGIFFRLARGNGLRVWVESDGTWHYAQGSHGEIDSGSFKGLKTAEGSSNTIELAASGDDAYLAVNGKQIASFDIGIRGVRGDIALAIGISEDTFQAGAETPYSKFEIWELPDDGPDPATKSDSALLKAAREISDSDDPAAKPFDGTLTEVEDQLTYFSADVDETDFYASATAVNPRDDKDAGFDLGFRFRDSSDEDQYSLVISSGSEWFLLLGLNTTVRAENFEGLNTGAGEENTFELMAVSDRAVFAVNGEVIAGLELADLQTAGDVHFGVGFYPSDVVDGDETEVSDFAVWSLKGADLTGSNGGDDDPTVEPTAGNDDASKYESPTYGFSLSVSDGWELYDQTSEDNYDAAFLRDDDSYVTVSGYASTMSPEECVDGAQNYYATAESYSDLAPFEDTESGESTGSTDDWAWGMFQVTFTPEGGDSTDYVLRVECHPITAGETVLEVDAFIPAGDQVEDELGLLTELLKGLKIHAPKLGKVPSGDTPTPEGGDESTPTSVVVLDAIGRDGFDAVGSVADAGKSSAVAVIYDPSAADAVVVSIASGSCDDPSLEPEGEEIEGGIGTITFDATYDELTSGDYVILLTVDDDPVSCGAIAKD